MRELCPEGNMKKKKAGDFILFSGRFAGFPVRRVPLDYLYAMVMKPWVKPYVRTAIESYLRGLSAEHQQVRILRERKEFAAEGGI